MNIAESSVRFPITVIVRVLLVLVFGYVCSTFLSVELKPDTQQPTLVVATTFPGAGPLKKLAMAAVGGLSVATLFTLVFIPVVYTILEDVKARFWKVQPITFEEIEGEMEQKTT
jgi:multidrug efflux pump subunit AcrB